jgi:hypothetical protein
MSLLVYSRRRSLCRLTRPVFGDGRGRIGFAEDSNGRIFALTAGSWRVLERVD